MESLPTELLLEIFDLACADNVTVARSLSLVSRRVHKTSRPIRFRTVSLCATVANLQALIHNIVVERKRSPDMLPKCLHLFLECPTSHGCELGTPRILQDTLTFTPRGGRSSAHVFSYSNFGRTENGRNQWAEYLSSLLEIVAQDLETFTLVAPPDLDGPVVLPCSFPTLCELTVVGRGLPLGFDPNIGHRICFPSLKRFHLTSPAVCEKSSEDITALATHAPKLTHLRISHFPRQPNVAALMRLFWKDRPHTSFPDLERVLIQPVPPPERCGLAMMYCDFITRLWCSTQRARVPVYLVPGDVKLQEVGHQAFVRKARAEWQDRIVGGEGCWAVKEDWANRSDVGHVVPWHLLIMGQR